MLPERLTLVEPDPPTVTAFVTVNFGLPVEAKVKVASVSADVPPIFKLRHTADVIFTFTVIVLPESNTSSELVGSMLLLQLFASPQFWVPAPPSQVF